MHMMRARRWVKVLPWYYTSFSGDWRAREKRAWRRQVDEE